MLLGIGAAGAAGYVLEPSLRESLTGEAPKAKVVVVKEPVVEEEVVSPVDLSGLQPEQLPEQILLKVAAEVGDPTNVAAPKMQIPAGAKVKGLRIEGQNLVISPGAGPYEGKVAIRGTDLVQQLAANPPKPVVAKQPEPSPVVPTPPPVTEPTPTPTPEPEVATSGESKPEPVMPEPTPTPATPAVLGETDVVKIMQESYKSGLIKEFVADKATSWKATGEEKIDGETYQTGLVDYSAETIFGVKNVQAKALIKGGKVLKWISPKSGMEIK